MLELSDNAVDEIKELAGDGGLRFVAQEGDEGSWSFDPSLADEPAEGDVVVERGGARVFLDAVAAEKLAEVILEIESHGDHVHFDFVHKDGEGEDGADDDGADDSGDDAA